MEVWWDYSVVCKEENSSKWAIISKNIKSAVSATLSNLSYDGVKWQLLQNSATKENGSVM